ncbi:MAG: hypothetical protein CMJ81_18500 [Planctomycetaceae bacterium]|nr:hypothetical protein [Planctomycetaceae bacterium]MBP61831.1 hypothetical protein [Planctomycetaceae bacterium]
MSQLGALVGQGAEGGPYEKANWSKTLHVASNYRNGLSPIVVFSVSRISSPDGTAVDLKRILADR